MHKAKTNQFDKVKIKGFTQSSYYFFLVLLLGNVGVVLDGPHGFKRQI